MKEAKAVHRSKTKKQNKEENLFSIYQQPLSSHFLGSRASVLRAVTSEDKYLKNKLPISTFPTLPPFIAGHVITEYGKSLWRVWDSSPSLPTPSLLAFGRGGEKTALRLCKHCSAIAKTLVSYQHCLGYTDKPQHYSAAMRKVHSIPTSNLKVLTSPLLPCRKIISALRQL